VRVTSDLRRQICGIRALNGTVGSYNANSTALHIKSRSKSVPIATRRAVNQFKEQNRKYDHKLAFPHFVTYFRSDFKESSTWLPCDCYRCDPIATPTYAGSRFSKYFKPFADYDKISLRGVVILDI
jgi:hypothetical protein